MASRAAITLPTADEVGSLLAEVIHGVAGGTRTRWQKLIGPVERLPTWRFVTHNWRVDPSGTTEQREVIDHAVEVVRREHPYIS